AAGSDEDTLLFITSTTNQISSFPVSQSGTRLEPEWNQEPDWNRSSRNEKILEANQKQTGGKNSFLLNVKTE
uniref:Uncharacterized protein n=1 Tax=Poecilia formosa TaxID=48698 RepID=A0A096MIJ7_POEFO